MLLYPQLYLNCYVRKATLLIVHADINILLWSKNFTPSVAFNIEFNIFFSGYPLCLDLKKVLYFEKYFKLDI